ncbi:hypothetical protein VST7929_03198 [Vibrio stylophorae]|uniref:DUF4154 domain-containing protein n=1 Tax=Vibrio stylophorae TaxID=659351 RepID=A0ABN8DY34_9VIBR|nr:hypothetical protein [Vibrio stylophorae]CAH0535724.1 hypothetical protein VST7929_03198 [Vibrio stylophorae]
MNQIYRISLLLIFSFLPISYASAEWFVQRGGVNGEYFSMHHPHSRIAQALLVQITSPNCKKFMLGVGQSMAVEQDFTNSINCSAKIDGSTIYNGTCIVVGIANDDMVTIVTSPKKNELISVSNNKIVNGVKLVTFSFNDADFNYDAKSFKKELNDLSQTCSTSK